MRNYTDYRTAVHWCNNNLVLCNNIAEVDDSVYSNAIPVIYDEETNKELDIFQWFITDCSDDDKEYLEDTFGLLFTYSEKLDCWILMVDHLGTSWDYVPCEVLREDWWKSNGEKYGYKH